MNSGARPHYSLLLLTLGLTYVATGILAVLPGASLIRLAADTHVSLPVAGAMFAVTSCGFILGAIVTGIGIRHIKPKYVLMSGLLFLGLGSTLLALTGSFPVLLMSQLLAGMGFGMIDISLNTIATMAFAETLGAKLNMIHGMYGLGALLGPLVLAAGLQFYDSLPLAYFVGAAVAALTILLLLWQHVPELLPRARVRPDGPTTTSGDLRTLAGAGLLWLMVLQISLYTAAEIGFSNWIVTAVSRSATISLALAAPVATTFFIGLTAGRLGGGQLLSRGWIGETRLLYIALAGGTLCGIVAALSTGRLPIVYTASALIGCFYGPLFPSIMAITSRRFVHAIGSVTSIMMIGTGASLSIVPVAMGLLIPVLGINWVMAIPALCCALVVLPMTLANREQRRAYSVLTADPGKSQDHPRAVAPGRE